MLSLKPHIVFALVLSSISCSKDNDEVTKSNEAILLSLELQLNGVIYNTEINGAFVSLKDNLPYRSEVSVKSIKTSPNATTNIQIGSLFNINDAFSIIVTAENRVDKNVYTFIISESQYLLFYSATVENCWNFADFTLGDYKVDNNMWNANNLPEGSYAQCIYKYESENNLLYGWEWSFPDDAYGISAYPGIVYGWKPWNDFSTTKNLPRRISNLKKVESIYEVELQTDSRDYNLAFDIAICSDSI